MIPSRMHGRLRYGPMKGLLRLAPLIPLLAMAAASVGRQQAAGAPPLTLSEPSTAPTFDPPPQPPGAKQGAAGGDGEKEDSAWEGPFGAKGSSWVTTGLGVAYDFDDSIDVDVWAGYSNFLIDNVEFRLDLRLFYYAQTGDDAVGANPIMMFRWHFYNETPWSAYVDLGIGVFVSSDLVPDGGTGVGFTPTAGLGVTRLLDESTGMRLDLGLRWNHISNARIEGDVRNPGSDGLMIYAGLMFPLR